MTVQQRRLPIIVPDDSKGIKRFLDVKLRELDDHMALIFYGKGTPEGLVVSPIGGLFMRLDGGATTTLYIKESGTGKTGWVAK